MIDRDVLSPGLTTVRVFKADGRRHRGESRYTFLNSKVGCYIAVEDESASKAASCQRLIRLSAAAATVAAAAATAASGQPLH